jgi:hypothetical protein
MRIPVYAKIKRNTADIHTTLGRKDCNKVWIKWLTSGKRQDENPGHGAGHAGYHTGSSDEFTDIIIKRNRNQNDRCGNKEKCGNGIFIHISLLHHVPQKIAR